VEELPISLEETKKLREELMDEINALVVEVFEQYTVLLCEHYVAACKLY